MTEHRSPPLDPFEDDLTRELPSALRTFTDLAPLSLELSSEILEVAPEDVLEIVEERGRPWIAEHTVILPRPASVPAFALDVRPAPAAKAWDSPLAILIAAALLVACSLAGAIGIVAGRSLSASAGESAAEARRPRVSVVAAAREVLTIAPLSAPDKEVVLPPPPVARPIARPSVVVRTSPPPAPAPPSAAGRGHLGSDREPGRDRGTTTPRR